MDDTPVAPATQHMHQPTPAAPSDDTPGIQEVAPSTTSSSMPEVMAHSVTPPVTTETPAAARATDLSTSVSKEATPNSSTRDENQSEAAPYTTRSRNRGNVTRPNYADDIEMDFEVPISKQKAMPEKRRSISAELGGPPVTARESKGPTIRLYSSSNSVNGTSKTGTSAKSTKAAPPSSSDAPPERKKRKYERHAPVAQTNDNPESRAAALASNQMIPGTSQFSAAPNGTNEAPPPKKRKTGDDVNKPANSPQIGHSATRESSLITFETNGLILKDGKLLADDGSTYAANDHIYLVCEPPGDPYYICRIMAFHFSEPDDPRTPVVSMLINWFYRPKDINRYSSDHRFLYASMQSDEVPIHSLRGKCQIEHRSQIRTIEEYRKQRDSFWFSQLYDRYSHRPYEMIPVSAVINVPENVKKALDDNWKFLVVEQARQKELTSAAKLCKRCSRYCAPTDSVDCGVCRETYHMACVDPPLSKKPSRGFAWSCGPCSRAQERKLEERHTTVLASASQQSQDEVMEEEEADTARTSEAPQPIDLTTGPDPLPDKSENASAKMWPWRYLGIHSRVEDVLQYDDRAIYPRASSRLGPRHQAATAPWFGQPVEYVKPSELRRKAAKSSSKKDSKLSKETLAAIDAERAERAKRPKWIQDEPQGYIERGGDYDESDPRCTATPLFIKPPQQDQPRSGFMAANVRGPPNDKMIDEYLNAARELGDKWGLVVKSKSGDPQVSTNYLDRALRVLSDNKFNFSASLESLKAHHEPALLGNPVFTKEEVKKFEDGVAKYGSDLRSVRKFYVKSRPHRDVVRFYYTWKFTERGQQVWGNNQGRKSVKKRAQTSWIDIADDEDDSAFDSAKAVHRKRHFHCNFCATRSSRQWRRAPGVTPGQTILLDPKGGKEKANQLVLALCQRCAHLWRRYGLAWEDPDDIAKSVIQSGGRAWKRKNDEEMLRELVLANEATQVPTSTISTQAAAAIGITITITQDSVKKKKQASDKESTPNQSTAEQAKKKAPPVIVPRPPTPPPEPVPPKWRELPCTVCRYLPLPNEQILTCRECKLTAHPHCYAVTEVASPARWVCDTCMNDRHTQHSLNYSCVLCPMADRPTDLLEPPKVTHKKKTDRDREKERLEKEMAVKMEEDYFREQKRKGRPIYPREAIKLTSGNNWVHITCAVWTPEIKFSDGTKMQRAEGMGAVAANSARIDPVCKLCRIEEGSCVSCHQCHAPFHVSCAHEHGYVFGFDLSPVKGARKDHPQHVTLGQDSGFMTAAIWCREHTVKTLIHDMTEIVNQETGKNVLQFYSEMYKQADLALTGTVRNAQLLAGATKANIPLRGYTNGANRRNSTAVNGGDSFKSNGNDDDHIDTGFSGMADETPLDRRCKTCGIDASLRWHQIPASNALVNGVNGSHTNQWQCHKCYPRMEHVDQSRPTEDESNEVIEALDKTPDLFRASQLPTRSFMSAESVETFGTDLLAITLTLTNPVFGGLHVFRGRDFAIDLNSDPTPLFRYISHYAALKCGYDQERDVIITEDGSWVTWPKSMMQALVKIIMSGSIEAHWRVMSARDIPCKIMDTSHLHSLQTRDFVPHQMPGSAPLGQVAPKFHDYRPGPPSASRTGYPPHPAHMGHPGDPHVGSLPPPQPTFPPAPSIPGVTPARRPSLGYGRPPELNGAGLPPQPPPGRPPTYPPPDALTSTNRAHPFYTSGPSPVLSGQMVTVSGSMQPPSPTSMVGAPRPATPRETGYNQASSSPNLRNILHP